MLTQSVLGNRTTKHGGAVTHEALGFEPAEMAAILEKAFIGDDCKTFQRAAAMGSEFMACSVECI